jgi:hypothetical protein
MDEEGRFVLYPHEAAGDGAALDTYIQACLFPNLFRGSMLKRCFASMVRTPALLICGIHHREPSHSWGVQAAAISREDLAPAPGAS